jgi:hypothetical protein
MPDAREFFLASGASVPRAGPSSGNADIGHNTGH